MGPFGFENANSFLKQRCLSSIACVIYVSLAFFYIKKPKRYLLFLLMTFEIIYLFSLAYFYGSFLELW